MSSVLLSNIDFGGVSAFSAAPNLPRHPTIATVSQNTQVYEDESKDLLCPWL